MTSKSWNNFMKMWRVWRKLDRHVSKSKDARLKRMAENLKEAMVEFNYKEGLITKEEAERLKNGGAHGLN